MNKLIHLSKKELDSIVKMMQTKEDTVCSISNQTLGSVFLPYGILGNVSNSKKIFQYGFGVVHIVQRRYEDNKLNESQITSFIILIYYIVKTQPLKLQVSTRFYVAFNGIKVIVDKNWYGNKESWIITGFIIDNNERTKKEAMDTIEAVNANYCYIPQFSCIRTEVGAIIASIKRIRQEIKKIKPDN